MKTYDVVQGSAEWWELHRGRLTASAMDCLLTPKRWELSTQIDDVICRLLGEKYMLGSMRPDHFVSPAMQWGLDTEEEARRWYEMEHSVDLQRIGFATTDDGRFGCSPDFLIGDEGLLQIKCPQPKAHVRYLLGPRIVPSEYLAQVCGEMIVCDRRWSKFLSYCPGFEPFLVTVEPADYTKKLADAMEQFWERLQAADAQLIALSREKGAA